MLKQISLVSLMVVAIANCSGFLWSQEQPSAAPPAGEPARELAFDGNEALAGWAVTGDVSIDTSKGRQGNRGALIMPTRGTSRSWCGSSLSASPRARGSTRTVPSGF